MPAIDDFISIDELVSAYNVIAPVWNDDVWSALQEKKFDIAGARLQDILAEMPTADWGNVYWMGMVLGAPAICGELDPITWRISVLPAIGAAAIKAASPAKLSAAYASVNPDELKTFHKFIIAGIPGRSAKEKTDWIKNNRPQLFGFFLASPLGLHIAESADFLSEKNVRRFSTLPGELKNMLSSFQSAEILKKIAEQNNIPEEKTGAIAEAAGLAILGYIHPEDIAKEIEDHAKIAPQAAAVVADNINKKLFAPVRKEIDGIYAPAPHDHELTEAPRLFGVGTEITPAPIDIGKIFGSAPSKPAELRGLDADSRGPNADLRGKNVAEVPTAPKPPTPPLPATTTPAVTTVGKPESKEPPFARASEGKGPLSEFMRLGIEKEEGEKRKEESVIGPKLIHEEPVAKPGAAGFRLDASQIPKFGDIKPMAPPPVPATIDYPGKTTPPPKVSTDTKAIADKTENKPRVVNYTELKTPIAGASDSNNPNNIRMPQIKPAASIVREEITAKPAAPPIPPGKPPMPPQPTPPAAQTETKPEKSALTRFVFGAKKTELPKPPAPPAPPSPPPPKATEGTVRPRIEPPPVPPRPQP